jgi:hypothetical protein
MTEKDVPSSARRTPLRELLAEARIAEEETYVTNAVKHFKWRPVGKRRIHDKPNRSEVDACGTGSRWLAAVRPRLVVCPSDRGTGAPLVRAHASAPTPASRSTRLGAARGRRAASDAPSSSPTHSSGELLHES